MSGLITPGRKLSSPIRADRPPKNSAAATWASIQASWSMRNTENTNSCREHNEEVRGVTCTLNVRAYGERVDQPDRGSVTYSRMSPYMRQSPEVSPEIHRSGP